MFPKCYYYLITLEIIPKLISDNSSSVKLIFRNGLVFFLTSHMSHISVSHESHLSHKAFSQSESNSDPFFAICCIYDLETFLIGFMMVYSTNYHQNERTYTKIKNLESEVT